MLRRPPGRRTLRRSLSLRFALTLLLCVEQPHGVLAPKGLSPAVARLLPATSHQPEAAQANVQRTVSSVAATAAAAVAAAAAAAAAGKTWADQQRDNSSSTGRQSESTSGSSDAGPSHSQAGCGGRSASEAYNEHEHDCEDQEESEEEDGDEEMGEEEDIEEEEGEAANERGEDGEQDARQHHSGAGKLWTKAEFPEGMKGPANYDMMNLLAAMNWKCPCQDRGSCLSADRVTVVDLYEHRKAFRTEAVRSHGGFRDKFRVILQAHYSTEARSFSRSFVVGKKNDCCAAAAGLAAGLSFATFATARADCTLNRPLHGGRTDTRDKLESQQRLHLETYLLELRGSMEGDKGGRTSGKWHTGQ
eukprot:6214561-Pleurochrysis_carterae.AAC.1